MFGQGKASAFSRLHASSHQHLNYLLPPFCTTAHCLCNACGRLFFALLLLLPAPQHNSSEPLSRLWASALCFAAAAATRLLGEIILNLCALSIFALLLLLRLLVSIALLLMMMMMMLPGCLVRAARTCPPILWAR
jgi:hypothetical protein